MDLPNACGTASPRHWREPLHPPPTLGQSSSVISYALPLGGGGDVRTTEVTELTLPVVGVPDYTPAA